MATTKDETVHAAPAAEKPKAAKLPEGFQPNEPIGGGTGKDKEGKPDGTLSQNQLNRAASEALLALRPQPSQEECQRVLDALAGAKVKTAAEGGNKAVEELNKQRG